MSTCPGICSGMVVFTLTDLFYITACHECLNSTASKLTGLSLISHIDCDNMGQSYILSVLLYKDGSWADLCK